jgi:hypothetical protein
LPATISLWATIRSPRVNDKTWPKGFSAVKLIGAVRPREPAKPDAVIAAPPNE